MKLNDIVAAYMAAQGLMEEKLAYGTAAALVRLQAELRPLAEYYLAEERKLMLEFALTDETGHVVYSGPNRFVFDDPKKAPEYATRRRELAETDVDVAYQRLRCPAPEEIRPGAILALDPFLEFEVK